MQACRDTLHPIFYTIKWFWGSAKFIKREISNEELIEATIKGLGGAISGKNTFLTKQVLVWYCTWQPLMVFNFVSLHGHHPPQCQNKCMHKMALPKVSPSIEH